MDSAIQLNLFGAIQVKQSDRRISGFESRKALAMLGFLAEQDRVIRRGRLVDLFWGDKPESRGRANLSRVLNNLTNLLPGCLVINREAIQFCRSAEISVDVQDFASLAAQRDVDSWLTAVGLYQGDFMAGMFVNGCPDFETWLIAEQELWRQEVVQTYIKIIDHFQARGQIENSLYYSRRLLALEPWREEIHRQMMIWFVQSDQRAAALLQYEACCHALEDGFGAQPSLKTRKIYENILAGERLTFETPFPQKSLPLVDEGDTRRVSKLPRTEHNLVQPPNQDVARVMARLNDPTCRLLTLLGENSYERKQLFEQVVQLENGAYPDGKFILPLTTQTNVDGFTQLCAKKLKMPFGPQLPMKTLKAQLFKQLRDKEMLLAIGNLDNFVDGDVLLVEILKRAPGLKILATSSRPSGLCLEWIFDV
jgi:DNA-binding SARP family transcriptional activator